MLRISLILFLGFVLLGLGLTAGYAMLSLRGPDDVIAEARGMLQKGDSAGTVRILDLCEPGAGMKENLELLRQLWTLRLAANRRIDNPRRCLEDIENLLRQGPGDTELELLRIYYLGRENRGELARQYALEFVAKQPQNARGLELAGEACGQAYRDALTELSKRLRTDLGHDRETEGIEAFLEYLYRPDGDAGGLAALQRLQQLYEHEPRFRQAWPKLQEELRALRERIQQALGYYQRSLELAQGAKGNFYFAAAYRGASFALRQADRRDDVVAQADIYLTNYDNVYCSEAAADAMRAHMQDQLWEAAVAIADRFLPKDAWIARVKAGKLDARVQDLLAQKAFALHHLGDDRALEALAIESNKMVAGNLPVRVIPPLAGSFTALLRKNRPAAEAQLTAVCNHYQTLPAPLEDEDPLDILMPLRIELARTANTTAGLVELAAAWGKARPGALEPLRTRARLQLATGQAAAAMATATELLQAAPTDEAGLRLLGEAADRAYRDSAQDSDSLLVQCIQRGTGRPDFPPQPVSLLLVAEAALRQQRPDIARACARAGSDTFPWSLWPRMIEARAELALGNSAAALDVLETAIARAPEDPELLALWFETSDVAGMPVGPHLPAVVRTQEPTIEVATALLQSALAETSPATTPLARAAVARADASPELLALAAQGLARAGEAATARDVLQRSRAASVKAMSAAAQATQTLAAIDVISAMATATADAQLVEFATTELQRTVLTGPTAAQALLGAARKLDTADRPRTAYLLTITALALGDAIECRDAASFRMAGDFAAHLGQYDAAAAHYTAAMSFPGGEDAAEPLARLELLRQNTDRAQLAVQLLRQPTDPALALLTQHPGAAELAQQLVRKDGSDLLAAVPFALASQVDPQAIGTELRAAPAEDRDAALQLCALFADEALAATPTVEARARALAELLPQSRTAALLLARALASAGKGADAQAIHKRLFETGCRALPLFGEVARTAASPGYVLAPGIRAELRLRAASSPDALPALVLAFTLRDVANEAAAAGNMPMAVSMLTELWVRYPDATKATTKDAELMLQYGLAPQAGTLLTHLRARGDAAERRRASTVLYQAAIVHTGMDARTAEALRTTAIADLDRGESIADALGFLLADPRRLTQVPAPALRRYLQSLLDRVATGDEPDTCVAAALAYCRQRLGEPVALELVDAAIAAHPAMAPYWIERARLLAEQRIARQGLDDARRMLAYVEDPQLAIEFAVLAGEQRSVQRSDIERLERVPPPMLATPTGKYALGLFELRRGRADRAEALLADAPPRPNGFHLYARALANLGRTAADARKRAAGLFVELGTRYPSSSLARNAGSFASQLAPN